MQPPLSSILRPEEHLTCKTPCAPILDKEDLPEEQKDNPNRCHFCGRVYSRPDNLARHMKQVAKYAPRNGNTEGMDKVYEHTLRKQQAQIAAMQAKIDALEARDRTALIPSPAPSSSSAAT